MKKYFIFGRCRKRLGRPHLHELKTFKFLGCTVGTDFDESHKPYQALYSRQPRNVYAYFSEHFIKILLHGGGVVTDTLNGRNQSSLNWWMRGGDYEYNLIRMYAWLISSDRTSETANDRLRILASPSSLLNGGGRGRLIFSLTHQLHSLLRFTLIQYLT